MSDADRPYDEFLEQRRRLMATKIPYRDAFSHERRFFNRTAGRFAAAGIPLSDERFRLNGCTPRPRGFGPHADS